MSDLHIVRPHTLTLAQARAVAQRSADELGQEYDLTSEWEGDTLHFHRSGVEGRMKVTEREIAITLKLGFLLRPFKAKFEEHITRNLEQVLAEGAGGGKAAPAKAKGAGSRAKGRPDGGA